MFFFEEVAGISSNKVEEGLGTSKCKLEGGLEGQGQGDGGGMVERLRKVAVSFMTLQVKCTEKSNTFRKQSSIMISASRRSGGQAVKWGDGVISNAISPRL